MATSSLKYKKLLRKLFPSGAAWQSKFLESSELKKLINSLAIEPCRIEDAGWAFLNDVYPDTTVDLLPDWERLLRLPDECDLETEKTIEERQQRVLQVLTSRGGQSPNFYINLAQQFGFDIGVIDVIDHTPFRAGIARAGERLTNGDWLYTFTIEVPADAGGLTRFRASQSTVGDRLLNASNPTLECLIQKHKPAHTIALFAFV